MKEEDFDELTLLWLHAKQNAGQFSLDAATMSKAGELQKKFTMRSHFGSSIILTLTVGVLVFYFYFLFHLQDLLSIVGYNLMIGGLTLRIVIEIFSAWRSSKIKLYDTTVASLQSILAFLTFRKRIHGPITITIFVLYFIGFYMLTPEFSQYLALTWLIVMDVSALFIAWLLFYLIKRGINLEMNELNKMVNLHKKLIKDNE